MTSVVSLRDIGKRYRVYPSRKHRLRELLSFGRAEHSHDFWALEGVNLDVEPGTTLGILGRNGAGKSTMLKIISGIIQPTTGTVEVGGRLAALFAVGAGFNPEFTGRENVMLNGLLLGIERKEILTRMDDIEAFADIGVFMDQPVKTYSSGMRSRLGFAVAVNVEPDVLVVDETLSAGDAVFKQMCMQRMMDLRDSGTTILFVSHSLGLVKHFCEEAVLLHAGRMVYSGKTAEAIDRYEALISDVKTRDKTDARLAYEIEHEEEGDVPEAPVFKEDPSLAAREAQGFRHGSGEARIENVEILDDDHQRPTAKVETGSGVTVRVHLRYENAVRGAVLGVTVRNQNGIDLFSTDTRTGGSPLGDREAGELVVVDFAFPAPFRPGAYNVAASVSYPRDRNAYLDRITVAATFEIERPEGNPPVLGLVDLPTLVHVHEGVRERQGHSA